jgi:hypothetical protein
MTWALNMPEGTRYDEGAKRWRDAQGRFFRVAPIQAIAELGQRLAPERDERAFRAITAAMEAHNVIAEEILGTLTKKAGARR